jgi:hypothetical protein
MNGSKTFMITNHASNHSAEDWAVATADHLVHVKDGSINQAAALRLELAIIDILTPHHENVKGKADIEAVTNVSFGQIIAASVGTPFETLWADEAVQKQIRDTLFSHFSTSAELEAA